MKRCETQKRKGVFKVMKIKAVGVGGGGSAIVDRMVEEPLTGVSTFLSIRTSRFSAS